VKRNVAECKIADATPGDVAQGFPRPWKAKPAKLQLDVLVVPVRYAGSQISESAVRDQFEAEFAKSRLFFEKNSYKRVVPRFTLESESQWVQVSTTAQQFVDSRGGDLKRVTQDIISLIPRQNLQAFDSIFIVAAGGSWYWGGMDQSASYAHPAGSVHSVYFQTGPASSTNFNHNLGHTAYYIEDLYLHPFFRTTPGADIAPLKYDVMSSGTDFTAWNRWLAGFIADSEVHCISPDQRETVIHLDHINSVAGEKLAVIPTGYGRALFLEHIDEALHVYELDSNIGHGAGPMKTIDTITLGGSLTYGGFEYTVLAADNSGIFVKVRR
jgi:hypothetical protein